MQDKEKQTLCILVDMFIVGGMERVILDSLKNLAKHYKVTLFIFSACADSTFVSFAEEYATVKIAGIRITRIFHILLRLPFVGGQLYRHYIAAHYDILIAARDICMSAAFGKIADKTIFWSHSDKDVMYAKAHNLTHLRKINKIRLTKLYQKCDQVWVLNDEIKKAIVDAFHPKRIEIVSNPIVCDRVISNAHEEILGVTYDPDHLNIVMVGRLSEEKGFIRVVRALKQIELARKVCLHIVGDGPERSKLEAEACTENALLTFHFHGTKTNPYPYIRQADLLICPSYSESFGIVMMEAMFLETPVLATSTIGARYLTNNGHYGILVNNSDEALLESIKEFINNPCDLHEMVSRASLHAKEHDILAFNNLIHNLLTE